MYDLVYYLSATLILSYLTFAASTVLFLEVKMWIDDRRQERDCARQLRDHKILVASQQRELDKLEDEILAEEEMELAEKWEAEQEAERGCPHPVIEALASYGFPEHICWDVIEPPPFGGGSDLG